jgi:hypothetical protein
MPTHRPRAPFLFVTVLSFLLVGCFGGHGGGGGGGGNGGGGGGNGGGGGSGSVGTAGRVVLIQPNVLSAQVPATSTLSLQADVHKGNGTGVDWGVQAGNTCAVNPDGTTTGSLGTQGGSASLGTVPTNTAQDVVVSYTPPNPAPAAPNNVFTITALQAPSTTGPCIVVTVVQTNNGLLSANVVFRLRGFTNAGLTFAVIGRFLTDGSGHITDGLEDVNIAQATGSSAAFTKVPFTGSYNMVNSSYGTMTLTVTGANPWGSPPPGNPPPTTMTFSFTLSLDGSFGGLIETDGAAAPVEYVGSGDFQIQGPSINFNTNRFFPSYILSVSGPAGVASTAVHKGIIGRLDLAATSSTSGNIHSGTGDDQSGTAANTNTPLSGTYSLDAPGADHGVFSITGGASPHVSFFIIRRGVFYALRIDANAPSANPEGILLGALHSIAVDAAGNTVNFDATSFLNSTFILNLLGITPNGHASAVTGNFTGTAPSGSGGTLTGSMDINDGGAVSSTPLGANFTISANGRGTLAVPLAGVTYNFVFYVRVPGGGGFVLEQPASDASNRGRSGDWGAQSIGPPIEASGANGTYLASTVVVTAASRNYLGVLPLNGFNGGAANSGVFNGSSYFSKLGSGLASPPIGGNFTVTNTTTGRGTFNMFTGTLANNNNAAFEVYDAADAVLVGIDNGFNLEPEIIFLDE